MNSSPDNSKLLNLIKKRQAGYIQYRWARLIIGLILIAAHGKAGIMEIWNGNLTSHFVFFALGYYFIYQSVRYWNGDYTLQFILDHMNKEHPEVQQVGLENEPQEEYIIGQHREDSKDKN